MKKIFYIAIFVLLSSTAIATVEDATIILPWSGSASAIRNTPMKMIYSDGAVKEFYYFEFVEQEVEVDTALSGYESKYESLYEQMTTSGTKITSTQAANNMSRWAALVTPKLYNGISLQNQKFQDAYDELNRNFNESERESAEYKVQRASIDAEYASKMTSLESSYSLAVSGVIDQMNSVRTQIMAEYENQQTNLKTAMENLDALRNSQSATEEQLLSALASMQKYATKVAECEKAISTLSTSKSYVKTQIAQTNVYRGYSLRSDYTNDVGAISHWLGSHENFGEFMRPVYPYDNSQYTNGENIVTWMNHIGVVGYLDAGLSEALGNKTGDYENISNMYFNSYCFYEVPYETVTNVAATFQAPTNWADNVTIICTNGVYTANAVTTIQTEHNGATASLREDEIEVPVNADAAGNRLIFRTADDSDVRINVSTNATGDVILTFGVYWK